MKHIDIFQNGWNNLCNNQLAEIKALRDENLRLVNKKRRLGNNLHFSGCRFSFNPHFRIMQ